EKNRDAAPARNADVRERGGSSCGDFVARPRLAVKPDHGGEEEQEGDHGDDHGHSDKDIVGAANRSPGLAEENEEDAEESLTENGDPRSPVAGMKFAERGGKIAVKAGNKR